MDFNKLTEKSQAAVAEAQALATRQGHQQVESEHLLLALLEQEGGLTETIWSRLDQNLASLKAAVQHELEVVPSVKGPGAGQLYLGARSRSLL